MNLKRLDIKAVIENPPPPLDFVLPGLLAGSTGMLVGPGGAGKTTLLLQVAMAQSSGIRLDLGAIQIAEQPARVVFLAAEESPEILRARLHTLSGELFKGPGKEACGILPSAVELLHQNFVLIPGAGHAVSLLSAGERTEFFDSLSTFCNGARLVIIDPLRRLHDGDENSSAAMTSVVQTLEALARKTKAAVLVAHHMNKGASFNDSTDSASASRGSSALTDAIRWQANLSGMTETTASAYSLTANHKSYVGLDLAKTNYLAPVERIWLKRTAGGALERVDLKKKTPSRIGAKSSGREYV